MSTAKQLYNFQQILPFNAGPIFTELKDKTVGELTDEQAVQAHEDWIRAQFGHMGEYYRPHLSMLLNVIDGLRAPVQMILFCPSCGTQHVDAPDERTPGWENPPHRSHLCHGCGCIWRPADVATVGVAEIKTRGKADTDRRQMLSHAGALAAIEAHVRSIEVLSDAHGFDPVQWLSDGGGQETT